MTEPSTPGSPGRRFEPPASTAMLPFALRLVRPYWKMAADRDGRDARRHGDGFGGALAVFEGLDRLLAGRTTFVISHRLTTIRNADVILVLDQGRLVERGTHDELVARHGLYADLQRLQGPEEAHGTRALGDTATA